MKKITVLMLLLLSQSVLSNYETVNGNSLLIVGDGLGCNYGSITAALAAANPGDEIRVVSNKIYHENITITGDITLIGGYGSCTFALNDTRLPNSKSIIDLEGLNGTVIQVNGSNLEISLTGFVLTNGGSILASAGIDITGNGHDIGLSELLISNNLAVNGGGLRINGQNNTLTLSKTLITENTSINGGGIYCYSNNAGSPNLISINNQSGITHNIADSGQEGNGGGIYSENCNLLLNSGEGGVSASEHTVGISANEASGSGGGLYAINATIITSQSALPINIDNNESNRDEDIEGDGGGIYLIDSTLESYNLFINRNKAMYGNGGGIYLNNSLLLSSMTSNHVDECTQAGYSECNLFRNNKAISGNGITTNGGALYMTNNSAMVADNHALKARFKLNSADYGTAISMYNNSEIRIVNSYFTENGFNGLVYGLDKSTLHVRNSVAHISSSTFAENYNEFVFWLSTNSVLNLDRTITYDSDPISHQVLSRVNISEFNYNCSIFHENDTVGLIPLFSESFVSADPGFINPAEKDFHLRFDSVAIDQCLDNSDITTTDYDLDIRGIDFFDIDNVVGRYYDIGADEARDPDFIFANSFE